MKSICRSNLHLLNRPALPGVRTHDVWCDTNHLAMQRCKCSNNSKPPQTRLNNQFKSSPPCINPEHWRTNSWNHALAYKGCEEGRGKCLHWRPNIQILSIVKNIFIYQYTCSSTSTRSDKMFWYHFNFHALISG